MEGWMDGGRIDRWMDRWMDGWVGGMGGLWIEDV